jgi:hypothetical protein
MNRSAVRRRDNSPLPSSLQLCRSKGSDPRATTQQIEYFKLQTRLRRGLNGGVSELRDVRRR